MKIEKYNKRDETYYRFRFQYGGRQYKQSGFKTRQEAMIAYSEIIQNHDDEKVGKIKFENLFDSWNKIYKTKVKESTYYRNLRSFELYVFPLFYGKYIDKITVTECQNFVMGLPHLVKGREISNQFKSVLEYAVKLKIIKDNPMNRVIFPTFKKSAKRIDFLEAGEVKILLDYFKNNLYWHALFRLMIYTGIRRGECLALEWSDIDFKTNKLSVNKSLTLGENFQYIVSGTKTESSIRNIILDKETVLLLKELKLQTQSKLLFPNKNGGYNRLSNIQDRLNTATRNTGIKKIRVHDLRHTHASLSFASGATVKTLQKRLGHSNIKTTMDIYVHVTKDDEENLVNNLVEYLEKKS